MVKACVALCSIPLHFPFASVWRVLAGDVNPAVYRFTMIIANSIFSSETRILLQGIHKRPHTPVQPLSHLFPRRKHTIHLA
jgi:hypothetical protein